MVYSFSYILVTALFGIAVHLLAIKTNGALPLPLVIFLATLYGIIVFHIVNCKNILATYKKLLSLNKSDLILLPLLVSASAACSYGTSAYYNPSILAFTFMAVSSLCASFNFFVKQRTLFHLITCLAFLISVIIFYYTHFNEFTLTRFIIMVILTITAPVTAYLYLSLSHKFNRAGFNAIEILTFRFWPLCITAGAVSIASGDLYKITASVISETFATSLITFILPVYFSQKAVEKVGAKTHGMMLGFTPLLAYIFENIILGIHDFSMLFFSVILATIVIMQNSLRLKYKID